MKNSRKLKKKTQAQKQKQRERERERGVRQWIQQTELQRNILEEFAEIKERDRDRDTLVSKREKGRQ